MTPHGGGSKTETGASWFHYISVWCCLCLGPPEIRPRQICCRKDSGKCASECPGGQYLRGGVKDVALARERSDVMATRSGDPIGCCGVGTVLLSDPDSRQGPGASRTFSLINQSLDIDCSQGGSLTLGWWWSLAEGNSVKKTLLKPVCPYCSQPWGKWEPEGWRRAQHSLCYDQSWMLAWYGMLSHMSTWFLPLVSETPVDRSLISIRLERSTTCGILLRPQQELNNIYC